jgi:hypothetical protein
MNKNNYSIEQIRHIEQFYEIHLPLAYKKILILLGDRILNFNKEHEILSIYKIQERIISLTEDDKNDPTYRLKKCFFITNDITYYEYQEFKTFHYFIEPIKTSPAPLDSPVYSWRYCEHLDRHLIEKFSDSTEEWLCKVSKKLYLEFQLKKTFFDISLFNP